MIGRGLLATVLILLLTAAPASAAREPVRCDPPRGSMSVAESWAQRRLDVKRVWPLTRGKGVTVAVVDSGVELNHPQIRVSKVRDYTRTFNQDCLGHGTAVAGIIAGLYVKGSPFYGVAPEARLVSLKQTNEERGGRPELLAQAIHDAADLGADVVNVSVEAHDSLALRAAVQYALARDVVIVAAVGNVDKDDGTQVPSFPAEYQGVLAVGAATPAGARADFSNVATRVSVLGPGQEVTSTWPGRAFATGLEGTSFAAPYVAGVAALVRSRFPDLNEDQVRQRIVATADGAVGKGTGTGMVNPLRAVTAILPFEGLNAPAIAPPPEPPVPPGAIAKVPPVDHHAIGVATWVAGGALALVAALIAAGVFVPMGRRRGWRPGRADVALRHRDDEMSAPARNH